MKTAFAVFFLVMVVGTPIHAATFTWEFSGTADSGQANGTPLAGLDYTLRLSTDAATPDGNFFNDFGQWFNLAASIDIETLGTRTLSSFTFIEQFRIADADRLSVRGPSSGPDSQLFLPLGTLGDPDFLAPFGPAVTFGDGRSSINIVEPPFTSPPFELRDVDSPGSPITVSGRVPEPAAVGFVGMIAAAAMLFAARYRDRRA